MRLEFNLNFKECLNRSTYNSSSKTNKYIVFGNQKFSYISFYQILFLIFKCIPSCTCARDSLRDYRATFHGFTKELAISLQ